MSFLARIAERAAGPAPGQPVLRPKDHGLTRAFRGPAPASVAQRQTEDEADNEKEPASIAPTAARSTIAQPESEAGTDGLALRRETTDGTGWADEDPELSTTEGTVARRAPINAETDEVTEETASDTARPARPDDAGGRPREDEPKPEITESEPEPNQARAFRHEAAAPVGHTSTDAPIAAPPGAIVNPGGVVDSIEADETAAESNPPLFAPLAVPQAPVSPFLPQPQTAFGERATFERPQVMIDQVDVLIHEPPPPSAEPSMRARARFVDARYLRRL